MQRLLNLAKRLLDGKATFGLPTRPIRRRLVRSSALTKWATVTTLPRLAGLLR